MNSTQLSKTNSPKVPDRIVVDISKPVQSLKESLGLRNEDVRELATQVFDTLMELGDEKGMSVFDINKQLVPKYFSLREYSRGISVGQQEAVLNAYCDFARGIVKRLLDVGMSEIVAIENNFNYGLTEASVTGNVVYLKHFGTENGNTL